MCGILGFNSEDEQLAKKLANLIKHRGPDGEGFYTDKSLTLGHRRLSIIDLTKKGQQPMKDIEEKIIITYNGEIFNYKEIKKELIIKGYKFKSKTDTEVIIYGYKEYGHKILDKLNGQFAFCIYDKEKKELFLARDRIGISPLYYYINKNKFVFGSELKVIMKTIKEKTINKFALNYYLMYGHTPREQSIINNAYKLKPGHYMVYNLKKKKITTKKQYWEIKFSNKIKEEKTAKKQIMTELKKSVNKRLLSDVPVGAFLSGGVDSSAIVEIISKNKKNLKTFSIKFDYRDFDESKCAKIVAKRNKTKHQEIEFSAKDVEKLIPKLAYYYDEPFSDPSMISTYLVSKVARKEVTVALGGDGGDELFGGYQSYKYYKIIQIHKYTPRIINKMIYQLIKNIPYEIMLKPKRFFEIGSIKRRQRYAALMSRLNKEEFYKLTGKKPEKYYEEYAKNYKKGDYIKESTNIDLQNYLSENNLTKIDRASLANSLESRPAFLDHKLIELATNIDSRLKIKKGETKYILKKSLEKTLPKKILYRKKQGFDVPLKNYFRNELRELIEKKVIKFDQHKLFKKEYSKYIKTILNKKKMGKRLLKNNI